MDTGSGSLVAGRWGRRASAALCAALLMAGCAKKKEGTSKFVYVTAKEATLRDRFAAVSNRTGVVTNGEKLAVLERARRAMRVKAPDGTTGWIEDTKVVDQSVADQFDALKQEHEHDPVIATAAARDEVYLHVAPGRKAEVFYRLAEGDGMSLMRRATVAKSLPPGQVAAVAPKPVAAKPGSKAAAAEAAAATAPAEPVMEDWWLVRTNKGEVGWIYSRMIDVTAPDALSRYAEGQRIVGAYVLAEADDPQSNIVNNGQPVTRVPEYVTVLSPYKAGLAYDFDQVRVYTWNVHKHRYETAFREKNIEGYLPVKISTTKDPYGKSELAQQMLPTFQYKVLSADAPAPVPDANGLITPGKTIEKTYRLEQTICHRILPPGVPPPEEAHPMPVEKKEAKARGRRRR